MRPVSANFLAAVSSSRHMASRVTVLTTIGQSGVSPTGTVIPCTGGSITFDSSAQVSATGTITTVQPWPVNAADLLTPYGNEVYVERGVVYGSGSTEWVGLGYYRIQEVQQQAAPTGTVELSLSDRMQEVIDARIMAPITYQAGWTVADVIEDLISQCCPWALFDIDPSLTTATLTVDQITTDDRYGFIDDLITSYGMVWGWDYRGYLVVEQIPSAADPVVTIAAGRVGHGDGVLVQMSRTLSRDSVYNACVASGQAAGQDAAPTAIVVDNDPSSATYFYGKFGQVPQFYSSSFLATNAQCQTTAVAMLSKSTGLPYEVDFGFVPNPALELYDPIALSYNNGTIEHHIIRQMVIGLKSSDTMTTQTKQLLASNFLVIQGSD